MARFLVFVFNERLLAQKKKPRLRLRPFIRFLTCLFSFLRLNVGSPILEVREEEDLRYVGEQFEEAQPLTDEQVSKIEDLWKIFNDESLEVKKNKYRKKS